MTLTLADLLTAKRFDALLLGLYGPALMPAQRPVLVSQWSKYYFSVLWRMALAGQAPLQVEALVLEVDERGLPVALSAPGPAGGVAELLVQHLPVVIARLAALGQVPAAVLWGNAGDCLDQLAGGQPALRQWFDTPGNPLYAAVGHDAEGRRVRRTCCLSYKVAWVGHCEHCPL
ncbi:siderophore-iron reductase FhuF [Pseudomonas sp. MAFF212428]|uniref:Siderophore-iron reductase FhuF n=1 Tax=Pseudomonas brassicae TaxID=2708063 RepID=A0A6B3P338_9PSED|nr:siderophore-iron reductase FhuF [Pseudomonas brassicae]NER60940.1 siderophore-iron reductase FhuF [Pseudomonas brassicae]NER66770.1 siderophore-iron reductase FhuF [Pseudomonas brassicae]